MQAVLLATVLILLGPVISRKADIHTMLMDLQISGAKKHIYHCGLTLAEVYVKKNNPLDIVVCSLWQTQTYEEKEDLLYQLDVNVVITKLKLSDMFDMIDKCNHHLSAQRISTDRTDMDSPLEDKLSMDIIKSGSRMIVPGTFWCGRGNQATSFNELGPQFQLDRCCRQHDMCPIEIKAFTRPNPTPYTKSLCECDRKFYECLKSLKSHSADRVGKLFFNEFNIDCVDLIKNPEDNSINKVTVPSKLRF